VADRVIYLDVDDEITSAATRIRSADSPRVAVVLPYGSRVATSRINFRLLSRDALAHDKRLAIVSGDSGTRALAASAGLPVFGSVAEYETSVRNEAESVGGGAAGVGAAAAGTIDPSSAASGRAPVASAGLVGAATASDAARSPAMQPATPTPTPPASVLGDTVRTGVPQRAAREEAGMSAAYTATHEAKSRTTATGRNGGGSRTTLVFGIGILALAGLIALVGAYLLLPSAAIGVTPQPDRIGPLDLTVVADPTATSVDQAGLVVPATSVNADVSASGTFQATGKRVEETKANGIVRFENLDFLNSNTVPAGSIVGTNGGVRFRTNGTVTVPKADIQGLSLFPGRISVKITAVKAGEDGNVDPNTIVVVPAGDDPIALKVTNPTATSGGTHEEFPRVTQQDVDGAMTALGTQLNEGFQTKLADPSVAPPGSTLFPATAVLGQPTPSVDPATLVGQEIQTFDLGATATGTALAVDTSAVKSLAESQLTSEVEQGHDLVPGSVAITVGDGSPAGQTVRFPVTASAEQIAILDADALKAMILGKSVKEARSILAPFGTVDVSVWPDWMGTIPSFGSRVTVTVDGAGAGAGAARSPSPSPSRLPSSSGGPSASNPFVPSPSATTP
jgi:hypothetical protein